MIEVLDAGLCDLVMDLGRPGHARLGVPAGGAADPAALAAANRLVGNPDHAVGLEILLQGPVLRFPNGGVVALTGGRFAAARGSGAPVTWAETLLLAAGETLSVGRAVEGCRCWLAVRGGMLESPVMGSCSTLLPAGFGGHLGRALEASDTLATGAGAGACRLRRGHPPAAGEGGLLRVVAGPQLGGFDDAALAAFFGSRYAVNPASDRRGVRLMGAALAHAAGDLPSQGVLPGAIQVPPDGQPIVLGWDGPVTGGYPVIATVIAADWPRLAQLRPGDAVGFTTVEVEAARRLATQPWTIEELA